MWTTGIVSLSVSVTMKDVCCSCAKFICLLIIIIGLFWLKIHLKEKAQKVKIRYNIPSIDMKEFESQTFPPMNPEDLERYLRNPSIIEDIKFDIKRHLKIINEGKKLSPLIQKMTSKE